MTVNGYAFKDLNRNGMLDVYEDWRRPALERAQDLAAQLSIVFCPLGQESVRQFTREGYDPFLR